MGKAKKIDFILGQVDKDALPIKVSSTWPFLLQAVLYLFTRPFFYLSCLPGSYLINNELRKYLSLKKWEQCLALTTPDPDA